MDNITDTQRQYQKRLDSNSDIKAHLPRLYEEAKGVVLELGVRGGVSTSALLAGVEERGGMLYSVDINCNCWGSVQPHPQWKFVCADSLDEEKLDAVGLPEQLDLLFIDTTHTYARTVAELELWGERVRAGGLILLHDTDNPGTPGVREAILEYCLKNDLLFWLYPGSHGLGVIRC